MTPPGGRGGPSSLRRTTAHDDRQGLLFVDDGQALYEAMPASPARSRAAAEGAAPTAPVMIEAAAPAVATHDVTALSYDHPQAARRVHLRGVDIGYAFARARRRSIGMVVGPEGLSVRAPRWVSLREVEAALHERSGWILEHLAGQRQRAAKARERDAQWRDGGTLCVFGQPVKLHVAAGTPRGCTPSWAGMEPPVDATLRVRLGRAAGTDHAATAIRDTVEAWLRDEARDVFARRCTHYAPLVAVQMRQLSLSSARTRWGSAGIDGSIRLNWRLMHHPLVCIDYVVVHELAHLRHMNHGPAFWRVVESVMPDHRAARKLLRDDSMSE